jgi:hypothetical protein
MNPNEVSSPSAAWPPPLPHGTDVASLDRKDSSAMVELRSLRPSAAAPRRGGEAVTVDVDSRLSTPLALVFRESLRRALARRPGRFRVRVVVGRNPEEVLVEIQAASRDHPLALYFPGAAGLAAEDVMRIVGNVLEAMGPAFLYR